MVFNTKIVAFSWTNKLLSRRHSACPKVHIKHRTKLRWTIEFCILKDAIWSSKYGMELQCKHLQTLFTGICLICSNFRLIFVRNIIHDGGKNIEMREYYGGRPVTLKEHKYEIRPENQFPNGIHLQEPCKTNGCYWSHKYCKPDWRTILHIYLFIIIIDV